MLSWMRKSNTTSAAAATVEDHADDWIVLDDPLDAAESEDEAAGTPRSSPRPSPGQRRKGSKPASPAQLRCASKAASPAQLRCADVDTENCPTGPPATVAQGKRCPPRAPLGIALWSGVDGAGARVPADMQVHGDCWCEMLTGQCCSHCASRVCK